MSESPLLFDLEGLSIDDVKSYAGGFWGINLASFHGDASQRTAQGAACDNVKQKNKTGADINPYGY